jgi:tetratricopeptide (TPR) repeat protein
MPTPNQGRRKVFVSYSHQDTEWLKRLQVHLRNLERRGLVELWDDTRIRPGADWRRDIRDALDSASVAILLISADFIASDFIAENELPPLLAAAENRGLTILPLILSPSLFEEIESLARFQTVNPPSRPLIKLSKGEQEEYFVQLSKAVLIAISNAEKTRVDLAGERPHESFDGELTNNANAIVANTRAQRGADASDFINSSVVTGDGSVLISNSQVHRDVIGRQEIHYHQQFIHSPPPPSPQPEVENRRIFNLPFPRNRFFTGREDILERLHTEFQRGVKTQALNGLGGIGKTQTAVEYAYRHRERYKLVLWAKAHSREALVSDFAAMAGLLDLPAKNAQDQYEAVGAVKRWFENSDGWLLILDDADDLLMVRDFMPFSEAGCVLLTTRAQYTGVIVERNNIEKMSPSEGAFFLLRRLRKLKKDETLESAPEELRKQAETLSKAVDGLPLALDQATAYVEETQSSLEKYLILYQSERANLLARRGELITDHPSVTVTFSLAFKKLEEASPAAADLLHLCAFFEADAIPEEIFSEGAEDLGKTLNSVASKSLSLTEVITEAGRFSLLQRNPNADAISVHRLVQAILKDRMGDDNRRMWAERAVRAVNRAFPDIEYSNWRLCDRLIQHAHFLALPIDEYGFDFPEAARMLNQAGYYLNERAQYADAEPLYQRALAIYEKTLGPEDLSTATCLNNLASLYRAQGRAADAEPLYKRALAIREKALGPEHQSTATIFNNLASLYESQGRITDAEPLYQRALAICEKSLGPEHPYTATSLNNLAALYVSQGKTAEAEPLYQRALDIREKALGLEHPSTANSVNNLAFLYDLQGRADEAEPLYRRALDIREKALGPEHPSTANSVNNLAFLYNLQGRVAEAEPLYQRALAICEKTLGLEHLSTATCLNNLASLYRTQGRAADAEPLYQRALFITEKALGPEHPSTANSINNLAFLYDLQGRTDDAEPLYKRALAICEKTLGPEHLSTATVLENYASMLREIKRDSEAEELEKRATFI